MKKVYFILIFILMMFCITGCNIPGDNEQKPNTDSKVDEDELEKNDHDHVYKEVQTKNPTCIEDGKKEYICEICGKTQAPSIINKLGHSFETYISKQPTCTESGLRIEQCKRCKYINSSTVIDPHGHSLDVRCSANNTKILIDFYCSYFECQNRNKSLYQMSYDTGVRITQSLETYDYAIAGSDYANEIGKLPKWEVIDGRIQTTEGMKSLLCIIYINTDSYHYNYSWLTYSEKKNFWLEKNASSCKLIAEYEIIYENNIINLIPYN